MIFFKAYFFQPFFRIKANSIFESEFSISEINIILLLFQKFLLEYIGSLFVHRNYFFQLIQRNHVILKIIKYFIDHLYRIKDKVKSFPGILLAHKLKFIVIGRFYILSQHLLMFLAFYADFLNLFYV